MSYVRFGMMIATSTVVMLVLMYLNTYAWEHVFFSETRTYMAIMMGASMAVIMLAYMLGMYGVIVPLDRTDETTFAAEGAAVRVRPLGAEADWRSDAELVFALDAGPTVGYRGFWSCAALP